MSLINDALKRARQAQTQAPPSVSPGPQMRPIEPVAQSVSKGGLILPFFITGIVALALLLWWIAFHAAAKVETASIAPLKENRAAQAAPVLRRDPDKVRATIVPAQPVSLAPVQGSTSGSQTETSLAVPAVKQPPLLTVTPPDKPAVQAAAPLKLEGILFHPAHPAAMIAGKTLFLNDTLGDWRVVAITPDSATLSKAGQTNVLTLPQ